MKQNFGVRFGRDEGCDMVTGGGEDGGEVVMGADGAVEGAFCQKRFASFAMDVVRAVEQF